MPNLRNRHTRSESMFAVRQIAYIAVVQLLLRFAVMVAGVWGVVDLIANGPSVFNITAMVVLVFSLWAALGDD